ncbi:MAG: hypothetical protein R2751_11530 [Bacteroidales bacterium]
MRATRFLGFALMLLGAGSCIEPYSRSSTVQEMYVINGMVADEAGLYRVPPFQ